MIPGMAYNPFVNEAREAYFDYEQVIVLNFWVERIKEIGIDGGTTQAGNYLGRMSGRTLDSRAKGASEFRLWFLGRSLENQSSSDVGIHEAFFVLILTPA